MRPLPTWPTNTFQSPKVATRAGLDASSFLAGLIVASARAGAKAPKADAAATASPTALRDERTRRIIKNHPLNRAALRRAGLAGFLPPDPGEISARRLAGTRRGCDPAFR